MNLKVPGTILPLGCAILSTRAKTVRGVGTTPLRKYTYMSIQHPGLTVPSESTTEYLLGDVHNTEKQKRK